MTSNWIMCVPMFCMAVAVLILVGGTIVHVNDLQNKMDQNLEEYGLEVTNDELSCWKICDKGDYFYSSGGLFSSSNCQCGVKQEDN